MYITLRIYRGITESDFRATVDDVIAKRGGSILWDHAPSDSKSSLVLAANDCAVVCQVPNSSHLGFRDFKAIGTALNVAWMELRTQDSALWDYSLSLGERDVHSFSTLPQYWDDDEDRIKTFKGDVAELCEVWGCERQRVERYLRQWKMKYPWYSYAFAWIKLIYTPPIVRSINHWYVRMFQTYETWPKGKAYPSDRFEYGNYDQMYDFLLSLGAPDPWASGASEHTIQLPTSG